MFTGQKKLLRRVNVMLNIFLRYWAAEKDRVEQSSATFFSPPFGKALSCLDYKFLKMHNSYIF